ncbi:hypothetical protein GW17_00009580 [Ensete ventricosum]|nr:hypothetical protein GW17_00009580 [Ensete ventricosum]
MSYIIALIISVYSGHGGARAAEYVKEHLFSNLIRHPKFISDTKSAIGVSCFTISLAVNHDFLSDTKVYQLIDQFSNLAADAYSHTDSEFLKSEISQNRDAGSTASTAILVGDRLLVANVGDSRAVISRGGKGKPQNNDVFLYRFVARVLSQWTWRVGGVLAVSRAFGDRLLKQFVVADPEIQAWMPNLQYTISILIS